MANKSNTENKINYGLKNAYYAPITEESTTNVTYGTPIPIPGAVNLSLKKSYDKVNVPADDDPMYATLTDNKGYDGDLEILNVPESFETDCLGQTIDGDTIVEGQEDTVKPFALMFEFAGDKKKRRHVLYRCIAVPYDIEGATKGEKLEAKSIKLTFTASPAKDTGHIKRSTNNDTGSVYNKWFSAVIDSTADATDTATE